MDLCIFANQTTPVPPIALALQELGLIQHQKLRRTEFCSSLERVLVAKPNQSPRIEPTNLMPDRSRTEKVQARKS